MIEGRTVSLSIPADVICRHNKNLDQLTHAAYEISRSACMFKVNELILLSKDKTDKKVIILGALLQFFITPRYLVKETFAKAFNNGTLPKNVFNKAKTMPIIPTLMEYLQPRVNKECKYREGISINKNILKHRRKNANGKVIKINKNLKTTKFVQVGLDKVIELSNEGSNGGIPLNVRVTVDMNDKKIVSVKEAWGSSYTGYAIRIAGSIIEIFTEVNTDIVGEDGYDISVIVPTCDFFHKGKYNDDIKEVNKEEVLKREHVVVVVVDGGENIEEEEKGVFDGKVRVPSGARAEEGAVVALGVVCKW